MTTNKSFIDILKYSIHLQGNEDYTKNKITLKSKYRIGNMEVHIKVKDLQLAEYSSYSFINSSINDDGKIHKHKQILQ